MPGQLVLWGRGVIPLHPHIVERRDYEFSKESRFFARQRANGDCEFPGEECDLPNTGRVNHLTGCGISRRLFLDPVSITNPDTNALMLCEDHQVDLDKQEAVLLYELDHQRLR